MDSARLMGIVIAAGLILLAFVGLWAGWRSLKRGQRDVPAPNPVPDDTGAIVGELTGLHAATTYAGEPLRRIAVQGLGFRARAKVTVTSLGIVLDLRGSDPIFIGAKDLHGVERASWAIDKGVEADGLVVIAWQLGAIAVDTYLRLDGDDDALMKAPALLRAGGDGT